MRKKTTFFKLLTMVVIFSLPQLLMAQEYNVFDSVAVIEDMWVGSEDPDANHEQDATEESELKVMNDTESMNTYLKFDISNYGEPLGKFEISFTAAQSSADFTPVDNFIVVANGTTNDWDENTINWNNAPAISDEGLGEIGIGEATGNFKIDVTSFVNSKIEAGTDSVSFVISGKETYAGAKVWISEDSWKPAYLISYLEVSDLAAPVVIPAGGQYTPSESEVELYHENSTAEIYYTIDGTLPSASNGTLYTAPFSLSEGVVTLKAVAIVDGESSNLAEHIFAIGTQEPFGGEPKELPGYINAMHFDLGGHYITYRSTDHSTAGIMHEGSLWQWRNNFAPSDVKPCLVDGNPDGADTLDPDALGTIGWASEGEWVEYTVDAQNGWFDIRVEYNHPQESKEDRDTISIYSIQGPDTFLLVDRYGDLPLTELNCWKRSCFSEHTVAYSVRLPIGEQVINFSWNSSGTNVAPSFSGLYFDVAAPDPSKVTGITLDKETAVVDPTVQLTATVTPSSAEDKSVTWSSNKPWVASVDQNGKVTGVSLGEAIITAKTNDYGFAARCTVTVESFVGVSPLEDYKNLTIHPNPANDYITISMKNMEEIGIRLTDLSGRVVKQVAPVNSRELRIDVSDITKGVYILQGLKNNKVIAVQKLIIE